jgi:hypothetical protein
MPCEQGAHDRIGLGTAEKVLGLILGALSTAETAMSEQMTLGMGSKTYI